MYIFGGMSREPPAEGVLFYGAKSHRQAPFLHQSKKHVHHCSLSSLSLCMQSGEWDSRVRHCGDCAAQHCNMDVPLQGVYQGVNVQSAIIVGGAFFQVSEYAQAGTAE